jgi:hypothetical protein
MKRFFFLISFVIISLTPLSNAQDFWQQTNGPYGGTIQSFAINSSGNIFAGTVGGVYRSTDNGNNWTQINTGLTSNIVNSLAINSSGNIFAGTLGGGVYRSVKSTTSIKEINKNIPSSFVLEQNYPNPFNSSTIIRFTISKSTIVNLKIYDVLGREVETLVDEKLNPGQYEVKWDMSGRKNNSSGSSGIYMYRMKAGEFVEMKKLLYLK